jgi:hypothetical protein
MGGLEEVKEEEDSGVSASESKRRDRGREKRHRKRKADFYASILSTHSKQPAKSQPIFKLDISPSLFLPCGVFPSSLHRLPALPPSLRTHPIHGLELLVAGLDLSGKKEEGLRKRVSKRKDHKFVTFNSEGGGKERR